MRFSKLALVLVTAAITSVSASAKGNEPCKVLTAEKFSKIMGYEASTVKTSANQTSCFYQGAEDRGGQFMILTETASGPGAAAMLNHRGSSPPPDSGLIGGTYRQGSIIFSVSIKSPDQAKLQALVEEVKRNLK
jgi:hypothetical protein